MLIFKRSALAHRGASVVRVRGDGSIDWAGVADVANTLRNPVLAPTCHPAGVATGKGEIGGVDFVGLSRA